MALSGDWVLVFLVLGVNPDLGLGFRISPQ
jgi:hypothetical protein